MLKGLSVTIVLQFHSIDFNVTLFGVTAYCVVAVEAAGRQIPMACLERIKEDFDKRYGGGKATVAVAKSLNKEFG